MARDESSQEMPGAPLSPATRQGQFLLLTGRKILYNLKRIASVTGQEAAEHWDGQQNLFMSLKKKWRCFSMCCCAGEASSFLPHHCFRERTKNAPPRVNYLGSHLSKLFLLISKEQYGSAWDLNQQQWNGADSNKQRMDREHQENTIDRGGCSTHLTWLKHGHATTGSAVPHKKTCSIFTSCEEI